MKPIHLARLARLRKEVRDARLDAVLVCPSTDLYYLTGADLHMRARPIFLVVTPTRVALFCPRLEADSAGAAVPGIPVWSWADATDPMATFRSRMGRARKFAVNSIFRSDWLLALMDGSPEPRMRPAAPLLEALREPKDRGELAALLAAAEQADRVMAEVRRRLRPGVREEELGQFVLKRFVALGAVEPWVSVASAANGAIPHHQFSDRKLKRGDVVVVDLGAKYRDYQSDITRTFFLGEPEPEARRVYAIVLAAQAAGRAAVWAGTRAREADRAARELIARHGYGRFFIHRLGHGLGLDVHEAPYLHGASYGPLPENSVVTVEPGIYLPGRFGVRLEDVVVATKRGPRTLTASPLDQPLVR